jgi:oligoendopeptidase F
MVVWNLDHLYPIKEIDKGLNEISEKITKFKHVRDSLSADIDSTAFMSLLKEFESIMQLKGRIDGATYMYQSENFKDNSRTSLRGKIEQKLAELENETIFFSLWFKSLDQENAKRLIDASGKYRYFLESLRKFKDFTLLEKEEKIINLKDTTGKEGLIRISDMLRSSFTFPWEGKEVVQAELMINARSPVKEKRHKAYSLLLEKYGTYGDLFAEIYKSLVNDWRNEYVQIRGYSSPITVRNMKNDVSDDVVDIILNVAKKNTDIFQEFFSLKAKIFDEPILNRCDIYAPLLDVDVELSWEQSNNMVFEAFQSFSPTAFEYAKEIFDLKHLHSELTPGKRQGAYCYTATKDVSPYVFMNYSGRLSDTFTLMHELGHAIHGRAARNQTEFTFHSSLPIAETASTFSELILEKKMIQESDERVQINLSSTNIDNKYATIMRQAFFVIFEKDVHDLIPKGATSKQIDELYLSNLKMQFGNSVEIPEMFKHEWKYVPHFFHTPFYCYAYAFGDLLGLSLFDLYKKDETGFPPKFMNFLALGGSCSPIEAIETSFGISVRTEQFWQKGFDIIREDLDLLKKMI